MGTLFKMVVAFGIGLAMLKGAQTLWLSAMQHRMAAVAQDRSYLPPAQPVTADFSKMEHYIDTRPQIDVTAAQQAGFQSQIRDMQLRSYAAQVGAPQIANGIPTMAGQGVPLQYQHPPGWH